MAENADAMKEVRSATDCMSLFSGAQDSLQDTRSCSQRRRDRVPEHIRAVLEQIPSARTEHERLTLRKLCSTLFRAHREAIAEERSKYIVTSGLSFEKSKKLHPIEGLKLTALPLNTARISGQCHHSMNMPENGAQANSSSGRPRLTM